MMTKKILDQVEHLKNIQNIPVLLLTVSFLTKDLCCSVDSHKAFYIYSIVHNVIACDILYLYSSSVAQENYFLYLYFFFYTQLLYKLGRYSTRWQ